MASTELPRKILSILRDEQAQKGFHLREQWLADALGVSRSPVRTALKQLEQLQVLRSEPHQGYFLEAPPGSPAFDDIDLPEAETDRIYRRIASERFANLVGNQVSAGDLVRRYGVSRAVILKVLARMQEDGLVEKTPGHGWVFGPALNDEASYQDSYRYRLLIEPAGLLEESFELPARGVVRLRSLHRAALEADFETRGVADLFDIDAEFHETLADACGNRFLAQAIRQQTRLRRLSEYEKYTSRERHRQSFGEHLSILDALEAGDRSLAAERMRAHILASNRTRPDFRKVRTLAHRRLTRR
jgi:DNA-binding GntR family transcriptional regulator